MKSLEAYRDSKKADAHKLVLEQEHFFDFAASRMMFPPSVLLSQSSSLHLPPDLLLRRNIILSLEVVENFDRKPFTEAEAALETLDQKFGEFVRSTENFGLIYRYTQVVFELQYYFLKHVFDADEFSEKLKKTKYYQVAAMLNAVNLKPQHDIETRNHELQLRMDDMMRCSTFLEMTTFLHTASPFDLIFECLCLVGVEVQEKLIGPSQFLLVSGEFGTQAMQLEKKIKGLTGKQPQDALPPTWKKREDECLIKGVKRYGLLWGVILNDQELVFNPSRTPDCLKARWEIIKAE